MFYFELCLITSLHAFILIPPPSCGPRGLWGRGKQPTLPLLDDSVRARKLTGAGHSGKNWILFLAKCPRWPWLLSVGTDGMILFLQTHGGDERTLLRIGTKPKKVKE